MQKTHDIEIDENDDIFKNDLLDRKSEIENLTPIVLNFNDPLVLALDSPWGTGKTTFVKLWQTHLKKEGKQSIYFNAWETDFAEDPLIVLVSELNKWVKNNANESVIQKWKDNIGKTLPNILKRAAVAGTKAATFGTLDLDKQAEGVVADLSGGIASDLLEHFDKQSKSIEQFKEIIEEVLKILPDEQKNLVIFIDELDRCRPTYAIELLERIKHLFSIERLVFVLSTDTTQLSHSICAVYGNDFDAKKYLQRFIDLDYSLKIPSIENYIKAQLQSLKINDYFRERVNANNRFGYEQRHLENCFILLAKRFSLKLRDINLLLMRIRLILCSVTENSWLDETLLVTLLFIRKYNKELYDKYAVSPVVANEIIKFIVQDFFIEEENVYSFYMIVAYLIAPMNSRSGNVNMKEFVEALEVTDEEGTQNTLRIIDVIASERWGVGMLHKPTIERIELLQRINL